MLAQNFKSHTELNLDEKLHSALQKVLVRLETNDLVYVPDNRISAGIELDLRKPNGFNMNIVMMQDNFTCGAVGCLAGWAAIEMGVRPFVVIEMGEDNNPVLEQLFYPLRTGSYCKITTEQAAIALRNYLTMGEVDWSHVA